MDVGLVKTHGIASVGLRDAATQLRARVGLRAAPGETGSVVNAAGVDGEGTRGGVVLRAHETCEGRGGDEDG